MPATAEKSCRSAFGTKDALFTFYPLAFIFISIVIRLSVSVLRLQGRIESPGRYQLLSRPVPKERSS